MHISVLQEEFINFFKGRHINTFVDMTLGLGGHSKLLLDCHPEITTLYGVDQDSNALEKAKETLKDHLARVHYIHSNFSDLEGKIPAGIDAILIDLGVSSMQLDTASYGMSFRFDAPLDMRMDRTQDIPTAYDIVNTTREQELANIIYEFGEERASRRIAKAICEQRKKKSIETTKELADCIERACPCRGKIHPATKTFQALRIYVNDELDVLKKGLQTAVDLLNPNGRLVVISFHSLEDRIVKHFFKEHKQLLVVTKKPLTALKEELSVNARSRSAKMRCAEKI